MINKIDNKREYQEIDKRVMIIIVGIKERIESIHKIENNKIMMMIKMMEIAIEIKKILFYYFAIIDYA